MSQQSTEREALEQHDQAPKRPPKAKGDNGDKAIAQAKQDAAKQQAASKAKQPTKAKAEPKPAKPTLTATAKKQLEELTKEIERLDGLKADRLAIMKKEHERGVPITEIAAAASYSVPRARQLLSK